MGYFLSSVVLAVSLATGLIGYFVLRDGDLPQLPQTQWGASPPDSSLRPFHLNVSDKVLQDLKQRLALEVSTLDERVEEPLEGVGFQYGMNKKFLKTLTEYWLKKYEWRGREKALNKYPQFKTTIAGLGIHFQHVKGTKKYPGGSRPLLLLHGWPGSFVEYQKMIPLLVDPKDSQVNFELVIPSLPGYGLSEGARVGGLGPAEMAPLFKELMGRLGYEKFYVQGGDWGSLIAQNLATLYPQNVLGLHMTMCTSVHPRAVLKFGAALALPQLLMDEKEVSQHFPLLEGTFGKLRDAGYAVIQMTKPETLGVAMSHSPSGWAAWVIEKFSFFTKPSGLYLEDGGIPGAYELDVLLDNVMVHWVGNSITSSFRMYLNALNPLTSHQLSLERVSTEVPTSCLNFPHEPLGFPQVALKEKFVNLVRYTHAERGGHLNGFEVPELVAQDILLSINAMESLFKK